MRGKVEASAWVERMARHHNTRDGLRASSWVKPRMIEIRLGIKMIVIEKNGKARNSKSTYKIDSDA